MVGVVEDLRKLGVQRWWMVARDMQYWKRILMKAETRCALKCY
jgi:hypothetical protein